VPEYDFTPAEQRFIERCAKVRVPVNVVEYQLELGEFGIGERHSSAGRARDVRDRAAAGVRVFVVDGLPDGRHVSLHATRSDAHDHFIGITPASTPADTVTATVTERAHGPVETLHHQAPTHR
jgi:hypothetical protein